jgi:RiboL-PSP-HEPN
MSLLDDFDSDLNQQIELIRAEFISRYFPADPTHGPDVYHHHVKAFCLLAHAAFEEFVEQLSLELMKFAIGHWYKRRVITPPLLSLCLFYRATIDYEDNEESDQPRNFDAVRSVAELINKAHSKAIFENHGFSLKYLRSILTPVAIDISSDPSSFSSLRTLADARGSYAHTFAKSGYFVDTKRAKHPMTPEKAREVVEDCLKLCMKLSADARRYLLIGEQ